MPYNGIGRRMIPALEDEAMTTIGLFAKPLLAFGLPGHMEWMVLLVLGLLIFGRRLPEVGRSLGRGIVEFKRGIKGIDDEIEDESSKSASKLKDWPKQSLESSERESASSQQADAPQSVANVQKSDDDSSV